MYESLLPLHGEDEPVWAPFTKRLARARVTLLTSAGFYLEGEQSPFDTERERREPTWGDPTHRVLPSSLAGHRLGMNHLHVNQRDLLADPEIALPLEAAAGMVRDGRLGALSPSHVSVMGYQERELSVWRTQTAPAIVSLLRDEGADGVVLAPV